MSRGLGLLLSVALAFAMLAPPARSGASLTAQAQTTGNSVATDSPANYLRLFSQGSDPAGLTGYAVKNLSSPSVLAATGVDGTLAAQLGAWKLGGTMNRVLTIQARDPLPVASITVTASVTPILGQSIGSVLITAVGSSGGTSSVMLTAGQKRQVNLGLLKIGGNNVLYTPVVTFKVTYPGYTGDFLSYSVPMTVWDGNGASP